MEGQGSEPHLLFDKHMIEFSPILPFSNGSEIEVTVSNPMDYPIEVYSLEFDKEYLIEEEVMYIYCTMYMYLPVIMFL